MVETLPSCQTSVRVVLEQVGDAFDKFRRDGTVKEGVYAFGLDLRIG